jgi:DNA-binding IscR family transcriptional regulator
VDGGYMLLKKAHDLSVLDIEEAIEWPVDAGLGSVDGLPNQSRQLLEEALNDIARETRERLGALKLSHLLEKDRAPAAVSSKA